MNLGDIIENVAKFSTLLLMIIIAIFMLFEDTTMLNNNSYGDTFLILIYVILYVTIVSTIMNGILFFIKIHMGEPHGDITTLIGSIMVVIIYVILINT